MKETDRAIRCPVKDSTLAAVQKILDGTWKDIRTRDRKGECTVQKFRVAQVLRIENRRLWNRHALLSDAIAEACKQSPLFQPEAFKTLEPARDDEDVAKMLETMALRDKEANECLLFHGTRPAGAYDICENGFRVDLAGSATGTLYGPGIYLAEASSKADEYAQDDQDGLYQGLYAMLLCRVACGVLNVCPDVRPDVPALMNSVLRDGTHHAVLGDREAARGTYREFVVFDAAQVYPEFIVIYSRHSEPSRDTE